MKKLFVILIVSVVMISMVMATVSAENVANNEKKDSGITIDSKSKTISYKITWNANGGKIGGKKTVTTTVKKGSKINKLITSPKRSGYTFKGFYTQKSGGTKITKNTKPSKSITYYAQWTKTTATSKLVGHWQRKAINYYNYDGTWRGITNDNYYNWYDYYFHANGRFESYYLGYSGTIEKVDGKYSVSNGKIYFKERKFYKWGNDLTRQQYDDLFIKYGINSPKYNYKLIDSWPDMVSEYKFGTDKGGTYSIIAYQRSSSSSGDPNFVFPGDRYTNKITW